VIIGERRCTVEERRLSATVACVRLCVGSLFHRSSASGAASVMAAHCSRQVISPSDRRSSTYEARRGSSDDINEQTSSILQLSPSCPCPSSVEVEHSDDGHLKHKTALAAKTAAVGNDITLTHQRL